MIEHSYKKSVSLEHRKKYGQFFTPKHIARLMTQWILKDKPKTILDPAFGLGVFYNEINRIKDEQIKFYGYEIDKQIISYFNNKSINLNLFNQDYLKSGFDQYDAIICNPPYMRFQNFANRHQVLPILETQLNIKINGYANMASIFLLKALNQLKQNGSLAFIMPFEFFNTGYGAEIKQKLITNYLLKQIILFNNEKDIFPEATTTVCILLCKNNNKSESIKIAKIESNNDLKNINNIDQYYQKTIQPFELIPEKKWTPIILSLFSGNLVTDNLVKLSEYGKFMRGLATGANKFFALKQSEIIKLGISNKSVVPCITKSAQIDSAVFTNDHFDSLHLSDRPVYCLNVNNNPKSAEAKYIAYGENNNYHLGYLTKKRSPWYRLETRLPAPILCGVFSRGRMKVVRNTTDAVSFTCFHSFYPNETGQALINKIFIYMLSDPGQRIIKLNKRSYGDNLDKFEPGDLNNALFPNQSQFDLISAKEADDIIKIAITDIDKAVQMSNLLIQKILTQ